LCNRVTLDAIEIQVGGHRGHEGLWLVATKVWPLKAFAIRAMLKILIWG
jgi:hypothetical protein